MSRTPSLRVWPWSAVMPEALASAITCDDLLAVEPAVLDEDGARCPCRRWRRRRGTGRARSFRTSRDRRSGTSRSFEPDAGARHQIRSPRDSPSAGRRRRPASLLVALADPDLLPTASPMTITDVGRISVTQRVEPRRDRSFLDPVLDVRPHPVLDRRLQLRPAVHERHVRAGAKHLQRRIPPPSSRRRR